MRIVKELRITYDFIYCGRSEAETPKASPQARELLLPSYGVQKQHDKFLQYYCRKILKTSKVFFALVEFIFKANWPSPTVTLTKRLYLANYCIYRYKTCRKVRYNYSFLFATSLNLKFREILLCRPFEKKSLVFNIP